MEQDRRIMRRKGSVILNTYRRPDALKLQYEAVTKQTVIPTEVLLWKNHPENETQFNFDGIDGVAIAQNNANYGVWARFAFALNTCSDYICVFDDDTIPGENWFRNCIDCIENEQNGLYLTNGITFNDLEYKSYDNDGWTNPNEKTKQVDIGGHAWFFHRDLLSAFWRETVPPISPICGEDMHFSYSIQKYMELNTYVPPHPEEDRSLWGSDPDLGRKFGVDENAISVNCHQGGLFGHVLRYYHHKGFKLLNI